MLTLEQVAELRALVTRKPIASRDRLFENAEALLDAAERVARDAEAIGKPCPEPVEATFVPAKQCPCGWMTCVRCRWVGGFPEYVIADRKRL